MVIKDAVKQLRATKVYLIDILGTFIRVRMRKSDRIVMEINVIAGEVPDDTITYLLAEAELLNTAKPDVKGAVSARLRGDKGLD